MSQYTLEFERPIHNLENQIKGPQENSSRNPRIDLSTEILQDLSPWERLQIARHPRRPHAKDYIEHLIQDFHELSGDRLYSDDPSFICGIGSFMANYVMVVAIEKGCSTQEKIHRNFGMPHPEGYRKALRVMKMAGRFSLPIVSFVDTPGAYPGIGAEERGQSAAIADIMAETFNIPTPIISLIIGEGGSGGALGIAIADIVAMLEHSVYSVISPESCASILWSDPKKGNVAANSLKINAEKAQELKIIDTIIKEPRGGAHKKPTEIFELVSKYLSTSLTILQKKSPEELIKERFDKFRAMGNSTLIDIIKDIK